MRKSELKFQKDFKSQGYTLLEVLVSVAIIGILIVLASTIFINTLQSANKANITTEARENISLAAELLERDVRKAQDAQPVSNGVILTYSGSPNTTWLCVAPTATANGYITRQRTGLDASPISVTNRDIVTGVSALTCNFLINGSTEGKIVNLDVTFTGGVRQGGAVDSKISVSHRLSATTRGY